ncbi:hypothetical protein [Paracoccus everestensis]|jgi:hypothetical protein|nr:hypothetical protein [Paracoccus everestensis]
MVTPVQEKPVPLPAQGVPGFALSGGVVRKKPAGAIARSAVFRI